ncbi:carboxylating nicotinate-nucleotide diphosphorylase [Nitratiruptor sp. SB155-2]|uniref:carboxylating nicotinate-nucleotide diphosphorylase n=1 Tax=Nitratiruptor sp. (strain SB155-2) TaxID=387092 RepID=UPI0001586EED|nr:carboxylating nicotinate-nucleotide diphosphorylase [Nitratiruptor sp. SB155-2]BAF69529.1 nicotinate-nucleotide pyrophosphorylase (carboxylating) [Nitratiruptor sp. SB155-2]
MNPLDFMIEAFEEDIGRGDLFERVAEPKEAAAKIVAKSEGVLAGQAYVEPFAQYLDLETRWEKSDGDVFNKGDIICMLFGNSTHLLQAERTILNTLAHASGIAAKARAFCEIAQEKIHILDTRKTRPKLRVFEKYAARVGGVTNHRMGLDDCLMIKDTHLAILGVDNLKEAIQRARKSIPFTAKIEVEAETLQTAQIAMEAGADIVMCDNMDFESIRQVVRLRNEAFSHVLLEASGNVTLENIEKYIQTGVDAISSGSIVHQAVWPDLSMKVEI